MARLIVKSPYIQCGGGRNAGGYLRYIGTRERVELLPDDRPPFADDESKSRINTSRLKRRSVTHNCPRCGQFRGGCK